MPNLNDILLFAQVVEAGSFAEAARRLGKPANSVSRRVQDLEAVLGLQLMQRSTRRLVLTEAGSKLFEESAGRLSDVLQFARGLVDAERTPSGTVRLAATADFLDGFRGEWIEEFFETYPKVRLELLLDDHQVDLLKHGVDVAFRGAATADPQLISEQVGTARRILVASPKYLARRGEPVTISDLVHHDCLPLLGEHPEKFWRLEGPHGEQLVEVSGCISASTIRALLLASMNGFGIALVPSPLVKQQLEQGTLQEVLPGIASHAFGIYSVHRANTRLTKAMIALRSFVATKLLSHGLVDPLPVK
jgi:DNA-binding transcriptional LysR family regulator